MNDKQVSNTEIKNESFINRRTANDTISTNTLAVRLSVLLSICPDNPFDTCYLITITEGEKLIYLLTNDTFEVSASAGMKSKEVDILIEDKAPKKFVLI